MTIVVLGSDKMLYIYTKVTSLTNNEDQQGPPTFENSKTFQLPCFARRVWYLQKHRAWLVSFTDNTVKQVDIDAKGEARMAEKLSNKKAPPFVGVVQTLSHHSDEITDCVEVLIPLCIATCSKDKTIVLFDLQNRVKLRTISDQHETWIFRLRY